MRKILLFSQPEIFDPSDGQRATQDNESFMERVFAILRCAPLPMLVLVLLIGCQQDAVQPDEEPPKSEVDLLEKEYGVTFFKKDVTLVDAGGSNEMVLRVSALEEALVEEFLESRKMSIVPVFEKRGHVNQINDSRIDESTSDELDLSKVIIVDIVSQRLDKGVIGLGLHNKINPNYSLASNARSKYLNPDVWHDSMNWPEEFFLRANQQVYWKLQRKTRWWSGWSTILGPYTWSGGTNERFYVDGPWRLRLTISFNNAGDYYYEFVNY